MERFGKKKLQLNYLLIIHLNRFGMYLFLSGVVFYIFSAVMVFASLMVISCRNPVHSVLFLILTFFSAAGIFILVGAEFLAMTLIIVYVGAVAVLFLFVIMMLDIKLTELKSGFLKYMPLCIVIPDALLVTNTHAIGHVLYTDYFYAFQISGLILFVAMVSSIVLTLRKRVGVLKQDVNKQLNRNQKDAIDIIKVPSGVGLDGMVN
jgi:NADH-quinone oxidoreductase subunit J